MSKQQQEIDLWAAGAFLISNDGLSVVMFLKWKNKDRTQFIGGSFPTSEKEEGLGHKATYNTCDFQVFGEKYKFETIITVNGNFYFKVVPLCELKPFDKVVVRDENRQKWEANFFSNMNDENRDKMPYIYECVGGRYKQCLPYNEETAKLIGTTKSLEDIR